MGVEVHQLWYLVIGAAALAGWWLAVRPQASYRGVSTPVSYLIMLMAALMCVLAVSGQHQVSRAAPAHGSCRTANRNLSDPQRSQSETTRYVAGQRTAESPTVLRTTPRKNQRSVPAR